MEKIIIDIDNLDEYIYEIGKFIDVDFNNLPFNKFSIKINLSKDNYINYFIESNKKGKVFKDIDKNIFNKQIDPFTQNQIKQFQNESIRKKLKKEKLYSYINVEINTNNNLIISSEGFDLKTIPLNGIISKDDRERVFTDIQVNVDTGKFSGNMNDLKTMVASNINIALGVLGFFQLKKEFIEVEKEKIVENKITKKKKKNKGNYKNKRTIYVTNKVYKMSEQIQNLKQDIEEISNSTTRQYHISEWYQRGHWRKYKNGKTIWIKGCFKHPKNLNKNISDSEKIYKLK